MKPLPRLLGGRWPLALGLAFLSGCSSSALDSSTAVKLRKLSGFYLEFAVSNKGVGPRSESLLKKQIKAMPDFLLEHNGIKADQIDGLFVSDRDNQPFVVLYGRPLGTLSPTQGDLVAYEATGTGGRRLAVLTNTRVEEVDDARIAQWTSSGR